MRRPRLPASTQREHAPHLPQRCHLVRKEHQGKLTDHHIERAVFEGQLLGIALPPVDVGPEPPSHGQHRLVEVEPSDAAGRPDSIGGFSAPGSNASRINTDTSLLRSPDYVIRRILPIWRR